MIHFLTSTPAPVFYGASLVAVLFGDYFAKLWSQEPRGTLFFFAALGYLLSGAFYIPVLLKDGLVVSATIWMVLNIIGFILIGVLVFKESITLMQSVGLCFGIIAVIILSVSHS